jgi:hypothetical protein
MLHASVTLSGIEFELLSSENLEVLNSYIDKIDLSYDGPKSSLAFSVHHVQIDDMRARTKSKFSVILSPSDSGLNSHLREDAQDTNWLSVKCNWNPLSTRVNHIHSLEIIVYSLDVKIDGDMVFSLLNMLGDTLSISDDEIFSGASIPSGKLQEIFMNAAKDILLFELRESIQRVQQESGKIPVFIEKFYHSRLVVFFEVLLGLPDPAEMSATPAVFKFMPGIIGSIAHASPTISFNEKRIENYFGDSSQLINPIVISFQQQAIVQAYKIFGSLDVIGDPLSLFGDIGHGFGKFLQKTEDEIASLDLKGEGVKSLVVSVVGGVFNSISKITGSVADLVNATTGTGRAYEMAAERDSSPEPSSGSQAANILFRSVMTGFSGLIDEPGKGFSREGSLGAVKGVFKGLFTLIATPVAGTLDAVSVVSDGVRSSLQQQGKPIGRRKAPTNSIN